MGDALERLVPRTSTVTDKFDHEKAVRWIVNQIALCGPMAPADILKKAQAEFVWGRPPEGVPTFSADLRNIRRSLLKGLHDGPLVLSTQGLVTYELDSTEVTLKKLSEMAKHMKVEVSFVPPSSPTRDPAYLVECVGTREVDGSCDKVHFLIRREGSTLSVAIELAYDSWKEHR